MVRGSAARVEDRHLASEPVSRDTNFYYSFLVLPREKRQAIVTVWDFCRAVDDAVDDPPAELNGPDGGVDPAVLSAEVERWRVEVARCFDSGEPRTEQGRRLKPCIARFGLPRKPFDDLVDGVEMDVGGRGFETFDELYQYCLRVASAVGLICIEIFGYTLPQAREYAVALGVALQLTNIIRDIPTDLRAGRIYLPAEDLARFGCTEQDLRNGLSPPVRRLIAFECDRARSFFQQAHLALPKPDARRLVAAEIMGAIYRAILDRIERRGYDVFREVVRVPRPRRVVIAASVWARTMIWPRSLVGR